MQRVEIIQDLKFETATTRIRCTPDGEYLLASGIYPPVVKVYELRELSLKFERHLDSEIVDFKVLSDDYSKLAFLCADRSVRLHAMYGSHYSLRTPRMGRDIEYDCWSCDILCAASSPDLSRINLAQGRFLSPISTQSPALNVVSRSLLHGLGSHASGFMDSSGKLHEGIFKHFFPSVLQFLLFKDYSPDLVSAADALLPLILCEQGLYQSLGNVLIERQTNPVYKSRLANALQSLTSSNQLSSSLDRINYQRFRKNLLSFLIEVRVFLRID